MSVRMAEGLRSPTFDYFLRTGLSDFNFLTVLCSRSTLNKHELDLAVYLLAIQPINRLESLDS